MRAGTTKHETGMVQYWLELDPPSESGVDEISGSASQVVASLQMHIGFHMDTNSWLIFSR
ncbi:hypothetical protein FIBSPDRAFT_861508 [Athelia psychrophila]|uniref:Uncharacterized protein n=1 Tax=Athelia psychrophila TaxID=1759441 RepID=A0A167UPA9_9AGAM|nr:hypothetical protein FIBSPDRAFT_878818 [Fibularhizoctonia sp. CBS 109695]KZP20501.1 hypothetical protein FIBSPDRAFT_861508 [Fibularhizoctonia sp. CBS 109695]